jgi:hypothetical protein
VSHDQNLNAWFGDEGVTIRPTLPETKRDQVWRIDLRLKAYGYGKDLADVPPVTSREVKGNRVQYERGRSEVRGHKSEAGEAQLVEWYENRAEGIEQGFTLNERPQRDPVVGSSEPLRLLLAVTGDLSARMTDQKEIQLKDSHGKGALSYGKLFALDADGKKLPARMSASADGREIALVVDDAGARYPIVIDPIMASFEKEFDGTQTDQRFGFAVALEGNTAVVGAWRTDVAIPGGLRNAVDAGLVYMFRRNPNDSSWSLTAVWQGFVNDNESCGWSVAISGSRVVYGCPGEDNQKGHAIFRDFAAARLKEFGSGSGTTGDRFGHSVAVSGNNIAVGSPYWDGVNGNDIGAIYLFAIESDGSVGNWGHIGGKEANAQLGTSVALSNDALLSGAPGAGAGYVLAYGLSSNGLDSQRILQASDGEAGDNFGDSVDVSRNTAVVGAFGDDDKSTDSGAAYVFVRDANGVWSQQQKLKAGDARSGDFFSEHAVAIEGNTIVVGADRWDFLGDDNAGAVYIFTRNGTVWTQQTELQGASAYNYGIGVDISGNSILIGARGADVPGVPRAGTAYVYRLDCVPPVSTQALNANAASFETICPGQSTNISAYTDGGSYGYQWRRNGVNIPGATDSIYGIKNASAVHSGTYDVIVSNSCGGDLSSPFSLTVNSFSLNPTSQNFGVGGSTGIVNVMTGGTCPWTAVSNDSFITVTSGASGNGSGTVGFTVAANPNSGQRTGSITIAGLIFNISQDGTNCSYSIAPTSQSLGPAASTNTVNVTAGAGCAWTATSNDPSFVNINTGASGTGNGTVTYTIAANSAPVQRSGTLTIAGQTFTVTQAGVSPTVLGNISTRLRVEAGDNALIGGFIVTGTQPKKVIVRAIGPSLTFAGKLANPTLELHGPNGLIEANDDWINSPNKQAIIDTTIPPSNDLESAIVANLPANGAGYTAIVRGVDGETGTGVVEAYDLDRTVDSKLANISTRGFVSTGDNVLIAGTIVIGQSSQKVLVRAIGPSLAIAGKLENPTLELRDANGGLIRGNDNWRIGGQEQEIIDTTIPPTNDFESAIVATLPAGGASYTAIVRGVGDTIGIAVVEVYALN